MLKDSSSILALLYLVFYLKWSSECLRYIITLEEEINERSKKRVCNPKFTSKENKQWDLYEWLLSQLDKASAFKQHALGLTFSNISMSIKMIH